MAKTVTTRTGIIILFILTIFKNDLNVTWTKQNKENEHDRKFSKFTHDSILPAN